MRRTALFILVYVIVSISAPGGLTAGDAYYVQSIKAKIMAGPSFKSKVLGEVSRGMRLASSGRQGTWIQVVFKGKTGYVAALLLSRHVPMERVSMIRGEETDIKHNVRRRASSYTSAAAARGLAADDRRRLSRDERVDYGALEKVEAFTLSSDDVERFRKGDVL